MQSSIHIFPSREIRNPYLKSLERVLAQKFVVEKCPMLRTMFAKLFVGNRKVPIYLLDNWIENYFFKSDGSFSIKGIFKLFIRIIVAKLYYEKIIIIKHNKSPHLAEETFASRLLLRIYYSFYDSIFIHDPCGVDGKKIKYLPHPLYEKIVSTSNKDENYYSMVGLITPHKNLYEFIDLLAAEVKIKIIGYPKNKIYYEKCLAKSEGKSVEFETSDLEEANLQRTVVNSSGLICTNDLGTSYISGNYLLAVSLDVPLISKKNTFLTALKERYPQAPIYLFDDLENMNQCLAQGRSFMDLEQRWWNIECEFSDESVLHHFMEGINLSKA